VDTLRTDYYQDIIDLPAVGLLMEQQILAGQT